MHRNIAKESVDVGKCLLRPDTVLDAICKDCGIEPVARKKHLMRC
jgi:hypothetical protein